VHFEQRGIDLTSGPDLIELIKVQAERCKSLDELCTMSLCFYTKTLTYDEDAVKKHLRPVTLEPLTLLRQRLSALDTWQAEVIQECINEVCLHFTMNMSKIAQPLRVAVTGSGSSPSIDVTLTLLGKEQTILRLDQALEKIKLRASTV